MFAMVLVRLEFISGAGAQAQPGNLHVTLSCCHHAAFPDLPWSGNWNLK